MVSLSPSIILRPVLTRWPERATSESIPVGSDDIMLNLEVADKIKGKEVAPDKAMRAIKGRLEHKNPNVQLLALKVLDPRPIFTPL